MVDDMSDKLDILLTIQEGSGWSEPNESYIKLLSPLGNTTICEHKSHNPECKIADHNQLEVSVYLCDEDQMQILNTEYRNKPKSTNVLSFSLLETNESEKLMLGDVVISLQDVEREAEEQKIPFKHHLSHLFVHGLLHLLGHDHENANDAEKMEAMERVILSKFGISKLHQVEDA